MSAAPLRVLVSGKRHPVRIGIINDLDAPEARMLALAIGFPGSAEVEYLSRHHRPLRGRNYTLAHWTDAATFGIALSLVAEDVLVVERIAESSAVYDDDEPRRWQGRERERIVLRPALAPIVADMVRQARAAGVMVREVSPPAPARGATPPETEREG